MDLSTKNKLFKIIDMSFASRRKNIKNNLKKANLDWDQLDIDQSLRPEEVSLENYLKIAKHYQE
jgi:16S rRNA A1518/A1519 N6-dimethyltransferase RsmA/KsgA/DIM1 with predicted DNA glycosylase/AP lyase activity